MTRDAIAKKLKEAGVEISAEALDFILSENGKDIEKAKGDAAKLQNDLALHRTEAEDLRKQIAARDADIAKLKAASESNADLQQQLGQWQEKYNTDTADLKTRLEAQQTDAQQRLDSQARQFRTEQYFSGIPFTSELAKKAAMAEFAEKNFPLEGDKFLGADDFIQSMRQANPAAFQQEAQNQEQAPWQPSFVRPAGTGGAPAPQEGAAAPFAFNFTHVREPKKE